MKGVGIGVGGGSRGAVHKKARTKVQVKKSKGFEVDYVLAVKGLQYTEEFEAMANKMGVHLPKAPEPAA